jgi:hypothetical protein
MGSESLAALAAHVAKIERTWDLSAALDATMLDMAQRTAEALDSDDLDALSLIGKFYWLRFQALPPEAEALRQDAFAAAVDVFIPCFLAELDIPEELLLPVAESALPAVLELQQQAHQTPDEVVMDKLPRLWRPILESIPDGDPGRFHFGSLLGAAHQMRFLLTGDVADLDEGIAVIEQAIAWAPADDPMLARVLMALGEARRNRFDHISDLADLDHVQQRSVARLPRSALSTRGSRCSD